MDVRHPRDHTLLIMAEITGGNANVGYAMPPEMTHHHIIIGTPPSLSLTAPVSFSAAPSPLSWDGAGWLTIPSVFLLSVGFLGIEDICVQVCRVEGARGAQGANAGVRVGVLRS